MAGRGRPRKPVHEAAPVQLEDNTRMSDMQSGQTAKQVLFAIYRCRYSSNGNIVTAEAGDEVVDPDPLDLQDLVEHGAVESFEPSQVQALLSLRDKDPEAKKRLARAIGVM